MAPNEPVGSLSALAAVDPGVLINPQADRGPAPTSSITLLALDPGGTTGWAVGRLEGQTMQLAIGQTMLTLADMHWLLEQVDLFATAVIYEDFEYRNKTRAGLDLTPVKLIGVIELAKELQPENHPIVYYRQKAATGKAYWTDPKLKEIGAYQRGTPHGRDASRHLLHYMQWGPGAGLVRDFETNGIVEVVDWSLLASAHYRSLARFLK